MEYPKHHYIFLLQSFIVIFTDFYYTSIWQKMQGNNNFFILF